MSNDEEADVFEAAIKAAILAGDDAADTYLVYADWLQSHNDPLGELIVVQYQQEISDDPEARGHFAKRAENLISANHPRWIGPLVDFEDWPFTWRRGFIDRVEIHTHEGAEAVAAIHASLAARLIRDIELAVHDLPTPSSWADPTEATDAVGAMERLGLPETVRTLKLSCDYSIAGGGRIVDFSRLSPRWQGLRSLRIIAPDILGKLDLPQLEELTLEEYTSRTLEELASTCLPRVARLGLWTTDWSLLPEFPADTFPNLRELRPDTQSRLNREALTYLMNAPIFNRVAILDLEYLLDSEAASELVRCVDSFRRFDKVMLMNCPLSSQEEKTLVRALGDKVTFGRE